MQGVQSFRPSLPDVRLRTGAEGKTGTSPGSPKNPTTGERTALTPEANEPTPGANPLAMEALLANFGAKPLAADQRVQELSAVDTGNQVGKVGRARNERRTATENIPFAGIPGEAQPKATPRPVDASGGAHSGNAGARTGQRQTPLENLAKTAPPQVKDTLTREASPVPLGPTENWTPCIEAQSTPKKRINPMNFQLSYEQQQDLRYQPA